MWYWTFYPFNFGKPVGGFGILGNHVGDWEHVRIRTVNQEPVSVDFHSHEGGSFSAGTMRWGDVEKVDGRAVGYSAAGSHGLWPDAGEHSYAEVSGFGYAKCRPAHWDAVDVGTFSLPLIGALYLVQPILTQNGRSSIICSSLST